MRRSQPVADIELGGVGGPALQSPSSSQSHKMASTNKFVVALFLFAIFTVLSLLITSSISDRAPSRTESGPSMLRERRDDKSCTFDSLVDWTKKHGATIRGIKQADFPLESGQGTRRGIAATEFIAKDEVIIRMPMKLSMSLKSAHETDLEPILNENPQLDSFDILILHIMHENHKSDSFWRPMLCMMPRSVPLPFFYTDEQIEAIKEPKLKEKTKTARYFAKARYNSFMPLMHSQYPKVFPKTEETIREFAWAMALVLSRTWGLGRDFNPMKNGTRSETMHIMVGLSDMFNHNITSYPASFSEGFMRVTAHRDTQPGEELFLSYGPRCNTKFLLSYGFIPVDNENVACPDEVASPTNSSSS